MIAAQKARAKPNPKPRAKKHGPSSEDEDDDDDGSDLDDFIVDDDDEEEEGLLLLLFEKHNLILLQMTLTMNFTTGAQTKRIGNHESSRYLSACLLRDNASSEFSSFKGRQPCKFGAQCYRKNPDHRKQFSHVGDADYPSSHAPTAQARAAMDVDSDEDGVREVASEQHVIDAQKKLLEQAASIKSGSTSLFISC